MTTEVHRDDTVISGEMSHLLGPEAPVTSQAVHEHKRRNPLPSLLKVDPHPPRTSLATPVV